MGAYEYVALDAQGRRRRGVTDGDSSRQVRQQLRGLGLAPVSVDEVVRSERGRQGARWSFTRVGPAQLALLTRQLATLVRSGLPLDDALFAVSQQMEAPGLKRVVLGVRGRVLEGHSLADALEPFPHVFPELYRATVGAGEQTRHLPMVLERLAEYTEARQMLRQKMQLALIYPCVLTATASLVVGGLLAYVVPEVVKVFEDTGQVLPALTRWLIALSNWVRQYGLLALVGTGLSVLTLVQALRRPGPRRRFHRLLLSVPIVGRLIRQANAARFAHTLNILLQSGLAMVDALSVAAKALSNIPIRQSVETARVRVREGEALHRALRQTGRLPPLTVHLIANGEAGGNLEEMLAAAARAHEQEAQTLIATLMGLLEPALILVMGMLVLAIVVAILLPIFELNQLV